MINEGLSCCFYHINSPTVSVCWRITDWMLTSHSVPFKVDLNENKIYLQETTFLDYGSRIKT